MGDRLQMELWSIRRGGVRKIVDNYSEFVQGYSTRLEGSLCRGDKISVWLFWVKSEKPGTRLWYPMYHSPDVTWFVGGKHFLGKRLSCGSYCIFFSLFLTWRKADQSSSFASGLCALALRISLSPFEDLVSRAFSSRWLVDVLREFFSGVRVSQGTL